MKTGLKNQYVLITGSSSGIGKGIAEGFLKEGSKVILTGRKKNILNIAYSELEKKYKQENILKFQGDLSNKKILNKLHQTIIKKSIVLNHIVCNIGSGKSLPILSEDVTEFKRMMMINLYSAVGIVNLLIPLLQNGTNNNSSSITFIGSICGIERIGCPIAYAASKAALLSYAKNISFPLGKKGTRVNVVSPGNILFEGSTWQKKIENEPKKISMIIKNDVSLGRLGEVEDVANVVVFLASECAKFISGSNFVVDGGQTKS